MPTEVELKFEIHVDSDAALNKWDLLTQKHTSWTFIGKRAASVRMRQVQVREVRIAKLRLRVRARNGVAHSARENFPTRAAPALAGAHVAHK